MLAFYLKKTRPLRGWSSQERDCPTPGPAAGQGRQLPAGSLPDPASAAAASRSVTRLLSLCSWLVTGMASSTWNTGRVNLVAPWQGDRQRSSYSFAERMTAGWVAEFGVGKHGIGLTVATDVLIQHLMLCAQTVASSQCSGLWCSALISR